MNQTGIGVKCSPASSAVVGNLGQLYNQTGGEFSLVIPVQFLSSEETVVISGADVNKTLEIVYNPAGTQNGISLTLQDELLNKREVLWDADITTRDKYWLKIVSTGLGDNTISLYAKGATAKTILAQTHDINYAPDGNFDLAFGGNSYFEFYTPILAYSRALTTEELLNIDQGIMPSAPLHKVMCEFPHVGLTSAAPVLT